MYLACISQDIAAEILEKVKADSGEMPRYKLVCQATVGESNGQSMRLVSRCLWDKDVDTCAETTWTNVRAPRALAPLRRTSPSARCVVSCPQPAEPFFARVACSHRTRCTPLRCALRCTTSERREPDH